MRALGYLGTDPFQRTSRGIMALQVEFRPFLAKELSSEAYLNLLPIKDLVEEEEFSGLHKMVCGLLLLDLARELERPCVKSLANSTTTTGFILHHLAATAGSVGAVQLLIDAGAEVNARAHEGWTPLLDAFFGGHPGPSVFCWPSEPQIIALMDEARRLFMSSARAASARTTPKTFPVLE